MKVLQLPFLCFVILGQLSNVRGQAKLIKPPSRSSMWRYGFSTPRNTNDNRLNCGGINALKANGGRCGICGDHFSRLPRPNEDGGRYATRTVGKTYDQGQTVPFTVEFNIGQKGYFEFRLCNLQSGVFEATQECLDRNLLSLVNGSTRMNVPATRFKKTTFQLVLPANITCERCVVQWTYVTSHTWGCVPSEKECCFGCGIQEKYVNCADVKIRSRATTVIPTTILPTTTTIPSAITNKPKPTSIATMSTTSSQIATRHVPSTTSAPNTTPPMSTSLKPPASTSTVSAAEVHIQELLDTQKAQLMELARLRKKIAEMASGQLETTTKALPTTTPATSGEPQNLQEFVQAFLSVTEKIHGNVPNSPSAMMDILRNVQLFEPVSTTPAPSRAEQFLETVLFPNTQSPTTTPPPPQPPAPPAPPQVQSVFAPESPRVNPFLRNVPNTNDYPPVYPQSLGSNQMMPSMQSMQAMNADLLGLNAETQSMFEMQGSPLLGEPSETVLGGVLNPMAIMSQMLLSQQQMPTVPQIQKQRPATLAAPPIYAQNPVIPPLPKKAVPPMAAVQLPSPTTVFTHPVEKKPEPLTLDTLSDLQRAEILQKLKMANLVLSKQAQPMALNEKLKVYRMVIDKALLTFNKEREERMAKSSPLVLTEITQNNHLLNQQKQIEKLQREIQRLKNQTLQTQTIAVTGQLSVPGTEQGFKTASLVTEKHGNEPPISREPNTPADIEPRRPVIPGTSVVHPLHSKPVDFTNVDPFTLMGLGAIGGAGLLEPLIKCKFIGAGEVEWACKRFCVPDVSEMSCSARSEFPQHKTRCAQDCAAL